MAITDVDPLVLKDVTLLIPDADFKKAVSAVVFTPTASSVSWTGLGSNTYTDMATATWTLDLTYVQDWETVGSLSAYLFANEGQTVSMTFAPRSGSGPSFTADVIITPGAIGGQVNSFAETTVSLGCKAKPVLVPAV
jgi:hypothetical protein